MWKRQVMWVRSAAEAEGVRTWRERKQQVPRGHEHPPKDNVDHAGGTEPAGRVAQLLVQG